MYVHSRCADYHGKQCTTTAATSMHHKWRDEASESIRSSSQGRASCGSMPPGLAWAPAYEQSSRGAVAAPASTIRASAAPSKTKAAPATAPSAPVATNAAGPGPPSDQRGRPAARGAWVRSGRRRPVMLHTGLGESSGQAAANRIPSGDPTPSHAWRSCASGGQCWWVS